MPYCAYRLLLATVVLVFVLAQLLGPSLNETGCVLLLISVLASAGFTAALYASKLAWLRSDRACRSTAQRLLLVLLLSFVVFFTLLCGVVTMRGLHAFTQVGDIGSPPKVHLRTAAVSAPGAAEEIDIVEQPRQLQVVDASRMHEDGMGEEPDAHAQTTIPEATLQVEEAEMHPALEPTPPAASVTAFSPVSAPVVEGTGLSPAPLPAIPSPSDTAAAPAPLSGLGVGLLCVILSVTRPNGVDYTTPLTRLLVGTCDRMAVYDGDTNQTRAFPWADVVLRGPADVIAATQEEALARAKGSTRDSVIRGRAHWRSKESLDYAYALDYAHTHRADFPFVLVLEDDIWFEEDFRHRLWEILFFRQRAPGPMPELHPELQAPLKTSSARSNPAVAGLSRAARRKPVSAAAAAIRAKMTAPPIFDSPVDVPPATTAISGRRIPARFTGKTSRADWFMWNLHYCAAFDGKQVFPHGSWFNYRSCTQALLYRSGLVRPLAQTLKSEAVEDVPVDGLIARWLTSVDARVLLASPSLVQHMGAQAGASSFTGNDQGEEVRGVRRARTNRTRSASGTPSFFGPPVVPLLTRRTGPVCWADDFPAPAARPLAWDREGTSEEVAMDWTRRTPSVVQIREAEEEAEGEAAANGPRQRVRSMTPSSSSSSSSSSRSEIKETPMRQRPPMERHHPKNSNPQRQN